MSFDPARRPFGSLEFLLLSAFILALRVADTCILRFDIDEPQHLHVVWAWATGQLPYRDVFDNHAPLFGALCAPIFWLFPERPDIVIPMRWVMLPIFAFSIYAVARLSAVFYSRNFAWLVAISGVLLPEYFLKSAEFRPDDLWAALWFLCLAILMERPMNLGRALLFGFLVGVSFSVSLKTTLLMLSLALAFAIVLALKILHRQDRVPWKLLAKCSAIATAGAIVMPAFVVAWACLAGIYPEFYYGTIAHNIVPGLKHWQNPGYTQPWFFPTLAGLILCAVAIYRRAQNNELRARSVLTFLIPGCYIVMLYGFWPDIPLEDDLPLYPLIPLALCLLGSALLPKPGRDWFQRLSHPLVWAVLILQLVWLIQVRRPWKQQNSEQIAEIETIQKLVKPDEFVLDPVAGGIYRHRPYFFAFETITKTRIRSGLTKDDIRQHLIDTGTKVAFPEGTWRYTKTRAFVTTNYVPLQHQDQIRVIGRYLTTGTVRADNVYHFDVVIPAKYSFVDENGERVPGTLDGDTCDNARELAAGPHDFQPASTPPKLALFWDRALELGYRPEFKDPETVPRPGQRGG